MWAMYAHTCRYILTNLQYVNTCIHRGLLPVVSTYVMFLDIGESGFLIPNSKMYILYFHKTVITKFSA